MTVARRHRLAVPPFAALVLLLLAAPGRSDDTVAPTIECGATVAGSLAAGESRTFSFAALAGEVVAIEALEVSGSGRLLQVRIDGPGVRISTCTGRIEPGADGLRLPRLAGGDYTVRVSSCFRDTPVDYAVTVSLVSDSRRNCGALLPCGGSVAGALATPGEVDAFRFTARRGDLVELRVADDLDGRGGVELRVFDPVGRPVGRGGGPPCAAARRIRADVPGEYTVLVNACFGAGTGAYRLDRPGADCAALRLRGVHSGDDAVELTLAADGSAVESFAVSGASCGVASFGEFTLARAVPVAAARFAAVAVPADEEAARPLRLDVDGVFADGDGDGVPDQAVGGFSVVGDDGRCHFQWAATATGDGDGDGWSDVFEQASGASARDVASTPESADAGTTRLSGPGPCRDLVDNDGDGRIDAEDDECGPEVSAPEAPAPRLFAGRLAPGGALWLERTDAAAAVTALEIAAAPCLPESLLPLRLDFPPTAPTPDARGRFAAVAEASAGGGASARLDGVVFDADGDDVPEQVVGRVVVGLPGRECSLRWWATGHLDADGDGWSDVAERRFGSDPLPRPLGRGEASVPEVQFDAAVAEVLGVDVCGDGIDNDGDGLADGEEYPDCPRLPQVTPTPDAVVCAGDCDGSGAVTVDEILALVAASLGSDAPPCAAGDTDADGTVTVDEIVAAVNRAVVGCA